MIPDPGTGGDEGYRIVFESHPLPMWIYDVDTLEFLAVNDAAIERYGYTREEFARMTIADIRPPEDVPELLENIARSSAERQRTGAWRHRRKDCSIIDVEITSSEIPFAGHRARLVVANDVTEQLQAEQERAQLEGRLRQIERLESLGQLAGGVAHDFNNILSVIVNYASFVASKITDEDARRDLNQIGRAAERAARLTHQLLVFARRDIVRAEITDLNAIIEETEQLLRRTIGEHIEVRVSRAADLWRIKVDPGEIERVVVNLAVNARDAMPVGGKLLIETANVELDDRYATSHVEVTPGRFARIAVTDTGIGMSPEVAARALEPFFTTKSQGDGTGLGLATVYGIVKQAGGHVEIYTEPEHGTTVKVYLPATEERSRSSSATPPVESSLAGRGETVLLVEDEEDVLELVRRMLSDAGYEVLKARAPAEAIAASAEREGPIHLLLTDVVMPGASGTQLARQLLAIRPSIKILYMSGYTKDAIDLTEPSGAAVLEKPFTHDSLLRLTREVLNGGVPS